VGFSNQFSDLVSSRAGVQLDNPTAFRMPAISEGMAGV
jgi:hypothetical protein